MERRDSTLFYGTKQLYLSILSSQGVVTTPRKTCYQKKKKKAQNFRRSSNSSHEFTIEHQFLQFTIRIIQVDS